MSALDGQLSQCMNDIEAVQKELDANLTLLAKHVDQGFGQLRNLNKQSMEFAKQLSDSGHEVAGMAVQLAGAAISGISGAVTAAQAAAAHNDALAKLMQQKVKIASERYEGICRIQKIAERNEATLFNLFSQTLMQEYSERELTSNPANAKGIINEINRVDDAYKLSRSNLLMVGFLLDEYKAWMNNQQKSGSRRPIPSFVNYFIHDWMFDHNNGMGLNLQSVISRKGTRGKITGAELLFLTDSSITACGLYNKMSNGVIRGIGVEPGGVARKLVENNSAYKEYASSLSSYNGWWHAPALIALVIVGVSIWFDGLCLGWMSEWWAFFRWVVMIIIGIIEFGVVMMSCSSLFNDEDKQKRLNEIFNKAQKKQLDEMGYVKIYEPDLKEKNVLWEGTKGFFNGIFG